MIYYIVGSMLFAATMTDILWKKVPNIIILGYFLTGVCILHLEFVFRVFISIILFSILYRNRGRIVTTDILCEELWPDGSFGLENSLIVHMRHLREKIEKDPSKPVFLKTVRGLGYKMEKI